jgi:hypothetical protein
MSVNCNSRVVQFDKNTLEAKYSLGLSASIDAHAALSDCYKGIEALETNREATGAEVVYFRAAISKFETVVQALRRMREILATGMPSDEFVAWIEALDYDRLYKAGTKRGLIPTGIEQWNRLVELMKSLDHLAVTDCLIADVEELRKKIDSMVDTLLSGEPAVPRTEQAERLVNIQTALVQFSTFSQMVAYLNAVEPTDDPVYQHVDMADLAKGVVKR